MRFGPVAVAQAEGALLAHAVQAGKARYKKGHRLSGADIAALTAAGHAEIVVARLDAGDVAEDEAAAWIGGALVASCSGLRVGTSFTGRANVYAETAGCFLASRSGVDGLNRIDPALTLASLNDGVMVEAGRLVATAKIIPFAVREASLREAVAHIHATPMLSLAGAKLRRVGLVATRLPVLKDSVMDKTAAVLEQRLAAHGATIAVQQRVAHETQAVADAVWAAAADCDLVVVFGASAIVDADDVIPAALRAAGGAMHRFGMPVDPGNLLLTGEVAGTPVIGAPGCARSAAENGFDWVLRRVVCGVPIGEIDLSGMGVGGLLSEITERPQPRDPQA